MIYGVLPYSKLKRVDNLNKNGITASYISSV
jgi:hypothetical protein